MPQVNEYFPPILEVTLTPSGAGDGSLWVEWSVFLQDPNNTVIASGGGGKVYLSDSPIALLAQIRASIREALAKRTIADWLPSELTPGTAYGVLGAQLNWISILADNAGI